MKRRTAQPDAPAGCRRLLVAGVGNIGSSLIPHLARMAGVDEVTILDHDVYEAKNLMRQDILPGDVGRPKAAVQARRLRRINPSIRVRAVRADLHDVPLGLFRSDVILGCLDSREARRVLNQAAWRLGVPLVDAGIRAGDGLLARVSVYQPSSDGACLECAWDERDYRLLEQSQPCLNGRPSAAATNAPISLGAIAAAVQAIECAKLLAGDAGHALVGRQVMLDVANHTHRVSSFRRNPHCRFDHATWRLRDCGRRPGEITLGELFELDRQSCSPSSAGPRWVRVEGRPFVRTLQCLSCGRTRRTLCLLGRMPAGRAKCGGCGEAMAPVGFDMAERLDPSAVDAATLARPLARLGVRPLDVLSVGSTGGGENHYVIGSDEM